MRFMMACVALSLFAGTARAEEAKPLDAVFACIELTSPDERLACFDSAVSTLRSSEVKGEVVALDTARMQTLQREAFGFSIPSVLAFVLPGSKSENVDEPRRIQQISASVTSLVSAPDGKVTLTLDNGQTWRQTDGGRPPFARIGAKLSIQSTSLGGFMLKFERGGPTIRVRRVE